MTRYLDILTILSIGLLIGTEFAVSVFINPVLWRLEDQAQAFAIKAFASKLGKVMPFWYVGTLLLLVAEAILRRSLPGESLVIGSCAVWTAVIVLTLLFLVPINNRIASVEDAVLSDAVKQEHKLWDARHRLRVVALTVAMILFLSVVVGGNPA
jgi:uncharacterized membrane protein